MTKKRIIYLGVTIIMIIALFFGGRTLTTLIIENQIHKKIANFQSQGSDIAYDSLYCSGWPCDLHVKNLSVTMPGDSSCQVKNSMKATRIDIKGTALIPLLFRKTISIHSIGMENPFIQIVDNFRITKDSTSTNKNDLRSILLHAIHLTNANIQVYDSSDCKLIQDLHGNFDLADVDIKPNANDTLQWRIGGLTMTNIAYKLPKKFYTLHVNTIGFTTMNQTLHIDSLELIPDYGKAEFMMKSKTQTDRVACKIPYLTLTGFNLDSRVQKQIKITLADVAFDFDIFRDKRYPSAKEQDTKLPVKFLYDLPIKIQIDEVRIKDSKIAYEEFPEKGESTDKAGRVFFEKLEGSIKNLSTIKPTQATMTAKGQFMNAGTLHASFVFPASPDAAYKAEGSLTNFNMPAVNEMLEPMAHARITSGRLNKMSFNFVYNNYRSDGSLALDYKDLKIETTRKDKNNKKTTNEFTTLLLNLFVKKDMDKNVDSDKKTGEILFYRADKKSLFNYWWKSILSGIKSVYNLDKIMDTSGKKEKLK